MLNPRPPGRQSQRGLGALVITLVLLFAAALGALYVNRGVLAEQRTSANQMQATLAHEVAEAGMEWVTGMLNSPLYIKADCTPDAASEVSFREKYLLTKLNAVPSSTTIEPAANAFPACKITPATGAVTCGCPAANAGTPDLDATERPSFSVGFEKINPPPGSTPAVIDSYAQLVKVTVWACSARAGTCTRDNFASAEGNARITTTLKVRPLLRAVPAAPLTCGRSCNLGGSSNIVNRDVATNGILINAGNAINSGGANITLATLPGQPAQNAQISNDASLAALSGDDAQCNKSKMFNAYFGSTIEQYKNAPTTKILNCTNTCGTDILNAYDQGWRAFYIDAGNGTVGLSAGNGDYGTQNLPIVLVTESDIKIGANVTFWGVIFSNSSEWENEGGGNSTINGAVVACRDYTKTGNGNTTFQYDPKALANGGSTTGLMVRVPGSWRDFRINTDAM